MILQKFPPWAAAAAAALVTPGRAAPAAGTVTIRDGGGGREVVPELLRCPHRAGPPGGVRGAD